MSTVLVLSDINAKEIRYEALVKALHADVYRYALWLSKDKSIAEELVQDTFFRAWKSLDSLKDEIAVKTWIISALRHENSKRVKTDQFDTQEIDHVAVEESITHSENNRTQQEVRQAISNLSEEYREPLSLQVIMGFNGDEIAKQLNLNKNTVITRLSGARSRLKEILSSHLQLSNQYNLGF